MKGQVWKGVKRPEVGEKNRVLAKIRRDKLLSEPDKLCRGCGIRKDRDEFSKNDKKYDGLQSRCKLCLSKDNTTRLQNLYSISKESVFDKLGRRCNKCGFTDSRALQIDHVNGGGRKEGGNRGYSFYRDVLKDTTGKYQVLCANCNWIKRFDKKEGMQRRTYATDFG